MEETATYLAIKIMKRNELIKQLENYSNFYDDWALQKNYSSFVIQHNTYRHNDELLRVAVWVVSNNGPDYIETMLVDSKGEQVSDESIGYADVKQFININDMFEFLNNIINPTNDDLDEFDLLESVLDETTDVLNEYNLLELDWFVILLVVLFACIFSFIF